jgi:hypothetical protein
LLIALSAGLSVVAVCLVAAPYLPDGPKGDPPIMGLLLPLLFAFIVIATAVILLLIVAPAELGRRLGRRPGSRRRSRA